jgi:hypothetical protein
MRRLLLTVAGVVLTSVAALAQQGMGGMGGGMGGTPGMGPVALHCNDDAATLCAGKTHQNREVRTCLEQNIAKVSPACRNALNSTGPGHRR